MKKKPISELVATALDRIGEERLVEELIKLSSLEFDSREDTLTIIANEGVHHLPKRLMRGEVFVASKGSLDFSSNDSIKREFTNVIKEVSIKLKEREWKKIYLVPFGPANLSMLIKLLVYRVTHIETVDVFYVDGEYQEIDIQLRKIIIEAGGNEIL